MAFQAMPYKMETVRAPLGYRRNDKWELTALRPCIMIALRLEHFWVADFGGNFGHLRLQNTPH